MAEKVLKSFIYCHAELARDSIHEECIFEWYRKYGSEDISIDNYWRKIALSEFSRISITDNCIYVYGQTTAKCIYSLANGVPPATSYISSIVLIILATKSTKFCEKCRENTRPAREFLLEKLRGRYVCAREYVENLCIFLDSWYPAERVFIYINWEAWIRNCGVCLNFKTRMLTALCAISECNRDFRMFEDKFAEDLRICLATIGESWPIPGKMLINCRKFADVLLVFSDKKKQLAEDPIAVIIHKF